MSKIEKVFTVIVLIMVITVITLCYQIPGCNTEVIWWLFVPLVAIRFIRAILLMRK